MSLNTHSPYQIEFLIGNSCNLRCVYCGPQASSNWGERSLISDTVLTEEVASLLSQWWPTTNRFSIIGGEPFQIPKTFELIETLKTISIQRKTKEKKTLMIISNLAVSPSLFQNSLKKIESSLEYINLEIGVSAESLGDEFEFIRDGATFDFFSRNLDTLSSCPGINISLMSALNILAMPNYHKFLEFFIGKLIQKNKSIGLSYNEVVSPHELSPRLFPDSLTKERDAALEVLKKIPPHLIRSKRYYDQFCNNLENLYNSLGHTVSPKKSFQFLEDAQKNRLKKMDWREVFPRLATHQP